MPIKNYTTAINSFRTVGEIQTLLVQMGATSIATDYENGQPAAIMFLLPVRDRTISYRLPARWAGVYESLCSDPSVPVKFKSQKHAQDVTWRIVQDWLEAHLALIETHVLEAQQVFLPYMVTATGETVYQLFDKNEMKLLE